MASRYSSPVMVTAPSVAVPTLVLRIVSIVVITEVAAAEFMVTVFIWISKNVATVSVVAVQLPPEKKFKCCVLIFVNDSGKYPTVCLQKKGLPRK